MKLYEAITTVKEDREFSRKEISRRGRSLAPAGGANKAEDMGCDDMLGAETVKIGAYWPEK